MAIRNKEKRISLFEKGFNSNYAIVAILNNKLIGIAGFHTSIDSLTGGITYRDLVSQLGWFEGSWAALIFSMYDRKPKSGELLMDGVAVHRAFRGYGIGSRLLDEIANYGVKNDFSRVRLDVIDTNSRAQKLYERKGFHAVHTERFPYLKWLLGFGSSTTMELELESNS